MEMKAFSFAHGAMLSFKTFLCKGLSWWE